MTIKVKFPISKRICTVRTFTGMLSLKLALRKDKNAVIFIDAGFHAQNTLVLPNGIFCEIITGGEVSKNWDALGKILQILCKRKHERSARIIAVGGGAFCDLVAMAASLYRRGSPLVLVPTTLLAQLDASVGGKTAVDAEFDGRLVKNFAGTFYPAEEVWLCPEVLTSLSEQERRSGVGELLKMLWLFGAKFDEEILQLWIKNGQIHKKFWKYVEFAIQAKAKIVEKDPYDTKRIRECLNYGHTVGHAIESLGDRALSHGEAIAWGMWVESAYVSAQFSQEILVCLQNLGFSLPSFLREVAASDFLPFFMDDKKMKKGKLAFTVVKAPGQRKLVWVYPKDLAEFLEKFFAKSYE